MRTTIQVLLTTVVMLAVPATASADFAHTITAGESLYSVAATDGLTVAQLAAANGLSTNAQLVTGATLLIPPQSASAETTQPASADTQSAPAQATSVTTSSGSGGYVVQPGDTLSQIAAANGITVHELAAENGLDPSGLLLAGARLSIPGAPVTSSEPATSSQPTASSQGAQPTDQTVSPADVGQVAADNGVSSSFAEAIAQQESGFSNDEVSSTGAVGVMQIEPGTWSFIQNLGPTPPLSPTSAQDNVRGGVLLLRSLLDQTGGDPGLAAAGYYQGLASVREHGLLPSTRKYVANVLALRDRFGGP
jgi:N-acetylmuramoyl-L-alanine amidase